MLLAKYYRRPVPLPSKGMGFEHATLDLKVRVDLNKSVHLAKDVAAFANHLGGTLIIGAHEESGRVKEYVPLAEDEANKTQDAFSKAVAQRCSPRPIIEFDRYAEGAGFVLTVLVYPTLNSPVGVKAKCDGNDGGFRGDAFLFPVRSGSDSIFLLPEQLSMYMLPEVRRVAILLEPIPQNQIVFVHEMQLINGVLVSGSPVDKYFQRLDVTANSLVLEDRTSGRKTAEVTIPIDGVRSVWQSDGNIHIALRGSILRQGATSPGESPPPPVFIWRT